MEWGDLVHKLLEHAASTKHSDRSRMVRLAKWLTLGKPELQTVIAEAIITVEQVMTTDMWQRVYRTQFFGHRLTLRRPA